MAIETYRSTFTGNQRFGLKIAHGLALEAAKQICESYLIEDRWKVDGENVLKQHGFHKLHSLDMPAGKNTARKYQHPVSGHSVIIHRTGHWSSHGTDRGQGSESLDNYLKGVNH
jgi:hypothetical protein